jgi:hypothetical protein
MIMTRRYRKKTVGNKKTFHNKKVNRPRKYTRKMRGG